MCNSVGIDSAYFLYAKDYLAKGLTLVRLAHGAFVYPEWPPVHVSSIRFLSNQNCRGDVLPRGGWESALHLYGCAPIVN